MAQLLVRKLDEALVSKLKDRATKNGRSVEEEHRLILREVLSETTQENEQLSLKAYLLQEPVENLDFPDIPRDYPSDIQKLA